MHQWFSQALEQYQRVQESLGKRDRAELSAGQKAILRNCCFAIGEILYAEEDYAAAVKAYFAAANRYQGRPESLDAYLQIAKAYRRLHKPEEAQNALQQAKIAHRAHETGRGV